MAANPNPPIYPLHALERDITCAACKGHYQKPKLLPCNHYFCEVCIAKMAENSPGTPFPCPYPNCEKATFLPTDGLAGLDSTLLKFVERKMKTYNILAGAAGKVKAVCRQCTEGSPAAAFCSDCADFVCGDCEVSHKKLTVFAGHKLVSLADLKNSQPQDIPLKKTPPPQCPDHEKPMDMFCFHCKHLICHLCFSLQDHHEHSSATNVLRKCAAETRDGVRKSLIPLQALHADISEAAKVISDLEERILAQMTEHCHLIQHSFDEIKKELDQRKDELITTTKTLSKTKGDVVRRQRESLQAARKEVENLVKLVEQNLENAESIDLMSTHVKLQGMVEEAVTNYSQLRLTPANTDEIICNPPMGDSIPKELGAVFLSSERSGIHVALPKMCRVGESAQFIVKVPPSMGTNVHVQLKSLVKPECYIEASIMRSAGQDTYPITYTPQVRGRHELTVKVNRKEISGSPFSVFVNIDPNLLGEPERILTTLNQPWGIAFICSDDDSGQHLVVTETGSKKITIMRKDGKRLKAIDCSYLHDLRGVAVGPDKHIFVVDKSTKSLYKFSSCGERRGTIGGFNNPTFIEIFQDKIYVPENESNEIKIVDMDCSDVRIVHPSSGSRGLNISFGASPCPKGIAGNDGKLFVSEGKKQGVYRYNTGNVPIAHISVKGLSKSRSSKGICFDTNDHLFMVITGKKSNGVYVYKSNGDFVISFGSDRLENAAGIAIDEDGFVYVCDFTSDGKIFVF